MSLEEIVAGCYLPSDWEAGWQDGKTVSVGGVRVPAPNEARGIPVGDRFTRSLFHLFIRSSKDKSLLNLKTGFGRLASWKQSVSVEQRRQLVRNSIHAGLCAGCEHLRLATSARSYYVRCILAEADSRYQKYPQLPVVDCTGFLQID